MDRPQNIWAVLSEWKKQSEEETKKNHYFYSKTNQMHQCIKFILLWNDIYIFRAVFPSIIRGSRLYIQQQAFIKQILLSACQANSSICVTHYHH